MRTVTGIVLLMLLFAAPATADTTCEVDGEPGVIAGDTCWTVDMYNDAYQDPFATLDVMDYMFGVSSEAAATFDTSVEPAQRQLGAGFGDTFTFEQIVNQLLKGWDV